MLWLLKHISGEPVPDGYEIDAAQFLMLDEIAARDDSACLVKHVAARLRDNAPALHTAAANDACLPSGTTADTWKLVIGNGPVVSRLF